MHHSLPHFEDWPRIDSAIKQDPLIETEVARLVSLMTIEEKLGQMIQPDLRGVTPELAKQYKLGSILNGGGAWPNENKRASASEWVSLADDLWHAVEEAYRDRPFRIPFMWATDAVHGHNNVFSATVFPHNIGLGAARDPELIEIIGVITAKEVAVTGLDWTFAPTVAVPRNLRWGRVYEGYSEDPEITYLYASKMVKGLQGSAEELKGDQRVISNVKHWVGDGGTLDGEDRGRNHYDESSLRNIHAMGYFSGLEAGAQVVMSSFNSWVNLANYDHSPQDGTAYNHKIHGSRYLIDDVLKRKMGFDGFVVTDWHGHAEVSKCSDGDATYAINAGNDVMMVPVYEHWIAVYEKALADIKSGVIPMSRVDDAVTRILRVKMRAGLWNKPSPSKRSLAGKQNILGAPEHRSVAREAVRKSLVLLKNEGQILPLHPTQRVILTGSGADDIQKQSGGWNLTWQGDENSLDDFPGATTVKMALIEELGRDNVTYSPSLDVPLSKQDVAIVVIGEDPYAEMMGDIKPWQTLEFAKLKRSYRKDAEKIRLLHQHGVRVITILFSGRPLYLNEEIAKSDAFVAAWLPGSEGAGITDVLIADDAGNPRFDFQGTLSYSWPNTKLGAMVSRQPLHIPDYDVPEFEQCPNGEHRPLFEYGYGLNYSDKLQTRDLTNIPLDTTNELAGSADVNTEHLYGVRASIGDYQMKVEDGDHSEGINVSRNNALQLSAISTKPYNYQQQQDAVHVNFLGGDAVLTMATGDQEPENFAQFYESGSIAFDAKVISPSSEPVYLFIERQSNEVRSQFSKLDITEQLHANDEFKTVVIPVTSVASNSAALKQIQIPFGIKTKGTLDVVIANIRWQRE
ncbi:glycoside hydrolase family 3 protein [Vibrio maritimus]|uniref:glycoside hydrolase family 3 protein n=1 Tax=Vibrio maritimus TaxID=990268 RepID=UPI001F1EA488|nr:glycoside hydrolase family 3 protein [Vibrio maritimus]